MAIGFPGSPFNKKQYIVDSKLYEYNSTLGAWSKGIRAPVSPGTSSITDISNLVDGSSLLNNVGSTIPSYATEVEVLSQSVGVQDGQMAYAEDTDKLYVFSGYSWYKTSASTTYTPPPSNLVTNGDFSTSDLTGWTEQFGSIAITNNALHVTRELGTGWCSYYTLTSLSVGTDYTLSFDISPNATSDGMRVTETLNTQVNGVAVSGATSPGTTLSGTFTATQTSMYLITVIDNPGTIVLDNISVEPV